VKNLTIHLIVIIGFCAALSEVSAQPSYTWTTIAGQTLKCGDTDGANTNALFCSPWWLTIDKQGTLYVSESQRIRKIQRLGNDWVVNTLNITNMSGYHIGYFWLAADDFGNLFVSGAEARILGKITPSPTNWVMTKVAPDCLYPFTNRLDCWIPVAMVPDKSGNIYVTAEDGTVRKISPVGAGCDVSIIAGIPGTRGNADGTNDQASFFTPQGIAMDRSGNLYVSDRQANVIRKLTPIGTDWVVTTIAGMALAPDEHLDGTNNFARFEGPQGIAVDSRTNLYVMDNNSGSLRMVRRVGGDWVVTSITERLSVFSNGAGGVAVDEADNVYSVDGVNYVIKVGMVAPRLQSARMGNTVVCWWPASASNYVLEASTTLGLAGSWIPLTNGIVASGDYLVLTNTFTGTSQFLRLHKQ
jgi:hypothetical protein